MKNIKVVHITFAFYPYMNLGGVPRAVYDLVRAQRDRYNVSVITNRIGSKVRNVLDGVEVLYLNNLSSNLIYRYQFYTPLIKKGLIELIRRADLLHFHGHRNLLNDIVYSIAKLFRKPFIISTHGTLHNYESKARIKRVYDLILGNRFVRDSNFIVAHSEVERELLINGGLDRDKIVVIPNGIYFDDLNIDGKGGNFFERYGLTKDQKVILFLGRITRRKGLDVALNAFRRLNNGNLIFAVAGEMTQKLYDIIKEEKGVIYTGHLDQNEKVKAILSSEILLYPSIFEAFGYVPFEAIYLKKACIVGDDFGTSEHLSPVAPELVVSYGDSIELSEVIKRFLHNRDFYNDVVDRARRYIVNRYSIENEVRGYDELYRRIIEA